MKLAIISDLHLEFRTTREFFDLLEMINSTGADCVVNAGDIHPNPPMRDFFLSGIECRHLHVLGNHDYYKGRLSSNKWFHQLKGGVKAAGCTLWTDFNRGDPLVVHQFPKIMNDGRQIKPIDKEVARDMAELHRLHLSFIDKHAPQVVVTHHAPSFQSVAPRFQTDYPTNYYFASDLDQFILDHPTIKLWIHGHMHTPVDYMVGETRVVSNPLGYPHENQVKNYKPLIIEL